MKNLKLNLASILLLLCSTFLISCSEEESPIATLDDTNETSQEVDLTTTLEDIDEVTLVGFQRNGFSDRTTLTLEEDLCASVQIEWLPAQKKMIIDFGEGCISPRGVTRKGKIIVTYTGRYWAAGTVITTTFDQYFVNERQIEGNRTVTNLGFNEAEKYFTFSSTLQNGKITWADGSTRLAESEHTRKVYLPNADRGLIYEVTGGSSGTNRNGKSFTTVINEPLLFAQRCIASGIRIPSSGVFSIQVQDHQGLEVDFGTTECDRELTIRRGGQSRTVTLPRS
ncbi:hypothetical protein [Algoriphagus namhaensis]